MGRLLAERRTRLTGHPLTFASKYAAERTVLFAEGFASHADKPLPLRWAHAVAHVLANVGVAILPDELIVGEPGVAEVGAERLAQARGYLAAYREEHVRHLETYPLEAFYAELGIARGWHSRSGHNVLDYGAALERGLGGLRRRAAEALASQPVDLAEDERTRRDAFYQAAIVALDGLSVYIRRHADLARELAAEASPERAAELAEIAETCAYLAAGPARTFREALQLVWFLNLATKLEDGGVGHSLGRLDQYLYPFYRADLESGRATEDRLLELLTAFWIKVNSECEDACHLTLGGLSPNGDDATNDLSYACLVAERRVSLTQPNLSARVHPGTPDAFWREIAATIRRGAGHPAIFNDAVTIPGLVRLGVPLGVARDYAKVGCVETFFAGRSVPWIDCYVNVPKCLELVLTGGRCLISGRAAGLPGPGAAGVASFDDLLSGLFAQLRYVTQLVLGAKAAFDQNLPTFQAAPLQSALTPCALDRGRDLYDGGAEYHLTGAYLVGLATTVDSLAAIRRLVFEEGTLTLPELVEILRADFAGCQALRARLLNQMPKYGNDDDSVDDLARLVVAEFSRAVVETPAPAGWLRFPMIGSVWGHVVMGAATGATADGRRKGEALSDGGSPAQGRSRQGATAALRSVAKPDHTLIPGGEAVNLTLSPGALRGETGLSNLVALLRGYVGLGGEQVQINVVSRATLEAAQREPEAYRHLVVRVAGFCAFFTCLDPETQREIIARTEHAL